MTDPIERQAAIDALDGEITVTGRANAEAVRGYANLVADRLKRLPSAQPEPIKINIEDFNKEDWERLKKEWGNTPITVLPAQPERKTGKWELIDDTGFRIPGYRCSVCHCECEDWENKPTYNFCPNCGAQMER